MNVDAAIKWHQVSAENLVAQIGSPYDVACRAEKDLQQAELDACQCYKGPGAANSSRSDIQFDVAYNEPVVPGRTASRTGLAAPQNRTDPRDQFMGVERFGQIVVRPDLQAGNPIHRIGPPREHQYGPVGLHPKSSEQFKPVEARQHGVQDDQSMAARKRSAQTLLGIMRDLDLKAVLLEVLGEQVASAPYRHR